MSLLSPQLKAFIVITEEGTVHGAAFKLGLTQTAVTQRIRALEDDLNVTLFTRSRKGMIPTYEGTALLRYCRSVSDLEGETLSKIRGEDHASEVRLKIIGPTNMTKTRVFDSLSKLVNKYPHVAVTMDVNDTDEVRSYLKKGLVDMAILPCEQVALEMDSKVLKPERYILVCSSCWKGRHLKEIVKNERIIDFNPSDQVTFSYLKKFKLDKLIQKERHLVNRTELLIELVRRGLGYTTITPEFVQEDLKSGKLIKLNKGESIEFNYALAWYPRKNMPAYFQDFVKSIK